MTKFIPKEIIDEIKNNINIVDLISESIPLNKKGNNYLGLCPFHQDTKPSFTVSESKGIYKCFACGESGDSIKFLTKYKGISYIDALEVLAQKIGLNFDFQAIKKTRVIQRNEQDEATLWILDTTNNFYKSRVILSKEALSYLKTRKLDEIVIRDKFDIGFASQNEIVDYFKKINVSQEQLVQAGLLNSEFNHIFWNRITFAIRNEFGEVVGFSARALNQTSSAKYINSPETHLFKKSHLLYNYQNAKEAINSKKQIIIVEGFMDVIALYRAGIENVVAIMGTALTKDHLKLIKNHEVIMFLDGDNAGINATIKSIKTLLASRNTVNVVINNLGKDPDEILNHFGKEKLINLLHENQKSAPDFAYDFIVKKHNLDQKIDFNNINAAASELINLFSDANEDIRNYINAKFEHKFNTKLTFKSTNFNLENNLWNNFTQGPEPLAAPSDYSNNSRKNHFNRQDKKEQLKLELFSPKNGIGLRSRFLIYLLHFRPIFDFFVENADNKEANVIPAIFTNDFLNIYTDLKNSYEKTILSHLEEKIQDTFLQQIEKIVYNELSKSNFPKMLYKEDDEREKFIKDTAHSFVIEEREKIKKILIEYEEKKANNEEFIFHLNLEPLFRVIKQELQERVNLLYDKGQENQEIIQSLIKICKKGISIDNEKSK
ncbi:DNA primase [Mycoplasmopsis gallopavonis]|uniref:DNA primase n=1 Tax=Mycoplasmopsis gallopavonis TaxID=76629 RepID=A0A449B0C7_9BACT|nr:DNA primase [Mycoplasmopsis gallopavonis]RIV16715.1 DNA primase [Mycoplasmopsis gallopavonis]VEU73177.1 DNA primase [Mycoplasmopsis gallopavonis]